MKYDPAIHHRRSIRLKGYDYSQSGVYFFTICTHDRECLFGEILDDAMQLNEAGRVLQNTWENLPNHYPHVELDVWGIMPNHAHGVIVLASDVVGAGLRPAPTRPAPTRPAPTRPAPTRPAPTRPAPTATATSKPGTRHGLPEIIRALKSFSSRRINEWRGTPGKTIWQRNYWEHIIRSETDYLRIAKYIQNNPAQWALDRLHPHSEWMPGAVGAGLRPAPTDNTGGA